MKHQLWVRNLRATWIFYHTFYESYIYVYININNKICTIRKFRHWRDKEILNHFNHTHPILAHLMILHNYIKFIRRILLELNKNTKVFLFNKTNINKNIKMKILTIKWEIYKNRIIA